MLFQTKNDAFLKNYVDVIVHELEEKVKNIYDQFNRDIFNIRNNSYIFHYDDLIKRAKSITLEKYLKYFQKYFMDRHSRKIKIIELYKKDQLFLSTEHCKK